MSAGKGTVRGQAGVDVVYVSFMPSAAPKAIAVVVHGYGEHMGRYRHVADALLSRAYAVYGVDHRGHGESGGARTNVERFAYFVEDLSLVVERARAELPGLPVFMVAHSMGGLIAVNYAIKYQSKLQAMVLSAPGLGGRDSMSPLLLKVVGVIARVAPGLQLTTLANGLESPLSRDPEIQELFDADPLCYHGKVKARMGNELVKATATAWAGVPDLRLPLLILHGTDDQIVPIANSERLYAEVGSQDKLLRIWEGGRHENFNELYKAEAIELVLDWLDEHMPAADAADTAEQAVIVTEVNDER